MLTKIFQKKKYVDEKYYNDYCLKKILGLKTKSIYLHGSQTYLTLNSKLKSL